MSAHRRYPRRVSRAPADALRSHPSITDFDVLESAERRVLCKYEATDTDLYGFVEASSLTVEFPVVARNGWFAFDLTGTRSELDDLRTVLEEGPVSSELGSVVSTADSESLVTDQQRELLETAIRSGCNRQGRGKTQRSHGNCVGERQLP